MKFRINNRNRNIKLSGCVAPFVSYLGIWDAMLVYLSTGVTSSSSLILCESLIFNRFIVTWISNWIKKDFSSVCRASCFSTLVFLFVVAVGMTPVSSQASDPTGTWRLWQRGCALSSLEDKSMTPVPLQKCLFHCLFNLKGGCEAPAGSVVLAEKYSKCTKMLQEQETGAWIRWCLDLFLRWRELKIWNMILMPLLFNLPHYRGKGKEKWFFMLCNSAQAGLIKSWSSRPVGRWMDGSRERRVICKTVWV